MPKNQKTRSAKGWRTILPDDHKWWNFVNHQIDCLAQDYGYQGIKLPMLIFARVYDRLVKSGSDYVSQNLIQVQNERRDNVVLRNDLVVPLIQAYINHNMHNLPSPLRFYSTGKVFNLDANSESNCHQSHIFNFSLLGEDEPSYDAQAIFMAYNFIKEFFIDSEIEINSFGCKNCQTAYTKKLINFVKQDTGSYYCRSCQNLLEQEPLKILNCQNEKCQTSLIEAPQVIDWLCEDCKNRFVKVLEDLDELDLSYTLNPKLIPPYPYWGQTIFSISRPSPRGRLSGSGQKSGKQILLSGGRQDDLATCLAAEPVGIISFFGQLETFIGNLKEVGFSLPKKDRVDVFVARLGSDARKRCFKLFNDLRLCQIRARESFAKNGLKGQLETATKVGARYTLIIGQKEIIDNTVIVRDMESGIQEIINFEKAITEIKKRLEVQTNGAVRVYKAEQ